MGTDIGNNAGLPHTGTHLVAPFLQVSGDFSSSANFLETQLGVHVKIPAPGDDLG
jgi:hypothetical protein